MSSSWHQLHVHELLETQDSGTKDCGFYALTVTGVALVLHNRWCDHIFCPSATLRLPFQCSWCALTKDIPRIAEKCPLSKKH